ncbi:MAG: rRNA maturation RNase YbeY [Bryobacteraceae bacterium]|jgi:probable rRNA maturation factor
MSGSEGSTVTFRRRQPNLDCASVLRFARRLQREVAKGKPFDCLVAGDAELRRLNREFRGKDYATDVLSFPIAGGLAASRGKSGTRTSRADQGVRPTLGDIAVSLARARAQARAFGHTTESEIRILILHGLLHLLGMDHETDGGRMARAEARWRVRLGLPGGLIERTRA